MKWLTPNYEFEEATKLPVPDEIITKHMNNGASRDLAIALARFTARMRCLNQSFAVVQLWRSPDTQAALYAQGRTLPGRIVTNAPPGHSPHECTHNGQPASQAFDIAMRQGAMLSWEVSDRTARFWSDARDTGRMCGLKWGRDLPAPPGDYGHFQISTFTRVTK